MDALHASARRTVHGDHVPDYLAVRGGRRSAGRRVRDRRARPHDLRRGRGHPERARTAAARAARLSGRHPRLRLYDRHQRIRAAERREDRRVVHRHHHRDLADLTRRTLDRAASTGGGDRWNCGRVHLRCRGGPGADHRQPSRHRTPAGVRTEAARGARVAPPAGQSERAVSRDPAVRRVGVQRRAARARRRRRWPSRAEMRQRRDSERDCGAAPLHPRSDGTAPARLLRLDRRESDRLPAQVPRLR